MKIFIFILLFLVVNSCQPKNRSHSTAEKMEQGIGQEEIFENNMLYDDLLKEFIATYDSIQTIDTTIFVNQDTYRLIQYYYCLFDTLIIPAKYNWSNNPEDLYTHNFASKLLFIKNTDTLTQRNITTAYFSSFMDSSLKNYAILYPPYYRELPEMFQLQYTITIPLTDVGIGVNVNIDLNGNMYIEE